MHSSRMRTARFSGHIRRGSAWGIPRGVHHLGVYTPPAHCVLGHTHLPCEQNNWQTGVKTLPSRNFVVGDNNWSIPYLQYERFCFWPSQYLELSNFSKHLHGAKMRFWAISYKDGLFTILHIWFFAGNSNSKGKAIIEI